MGVRTALTYWVYIHLKYGKTVESCNYLIMGKQRKTSKYFDAMVEMVHFLEYAFISQNNY